MSLIEQASRRLEEMRSAGVMEPAPERRAAPRIVPRGERAPEAAGEPRTSTVHIDLTRLASQGFVTPDTPRSRIADEFRVIKRPLIANAANAAVPIRNGNLIMV